MNKRKLISRIERHPGLSFGIALLIILILLDAVSAIFFIPKNYNSFRIPHPVYHHGLKPNQSTQNKWGNRVFNYYTNSLGFKDRSVRNIAPDPETKRILFIGDSFTEGVGITADESFVGILDQASANTEILNAGVVSYSPKLYYLKTKYLLETQHLKFDELIVMIDNSDPLNELTYERFKPYDQSNLKRIKYKLQGFLFNHSFIYYSISNIIQKTKRSAITQSWNPMSGESIVDDLALEEDDFISATPYWSFTPKLYQKWGKAGLTLAGENMQLLANLCRNYGIILNVVIYPWPSQIQANQLHDIQVSYWNEFCKSNELTFINLYPSFIGSNNTEKILQTYFIPGDVHWNQQGHKYVASLLYPYVYKN